MSFSAVISSDLVIVEPGTSMPLSLELVSASEAANQLEISIDGLDGEWTLIPVPVVSLSANETQTIKVFFKPPRASESTAGNYPFVVRVRSLINGEDRVCQGQLQIKPYHHLTLEISPRKGFITPVKRLNTFVVTAMNLGNAEHNIQFTANDPEDACAYEFESDQVLLGPGQQKEIEVTVNRLKSSPFGNSRLIGFAITGRSMDTPSVVATTQGQLELRPLFTVTNIAFAAFVVFLITILTLTQPKPPKIVELKSVGGKRVFRGGKVSVYWRAENASAVKLIVGNSLVSDSLDPEGTKEIEAPNPGTLTVKVIAIREGRSSDAQTLTYDVEVPPVIPDPKIEQLVPSTKQINVGGKLVLKYKFNAAVVKAKIAPQNQDLDLKVNMVEIEPPLLGLNEYTVYAENSQGKVVKQSFKIYVIEKSLAEIIKFSITPGEVSKDDAEVTISWQVANAERVELSYPGGKPMQLPIEGEKTMQVLAKTTFTLTAYDSKGKVTTKQQVVLFKKEAPPVDPTDPTLTDPGKTGGDPASTGTTNG